MMRRTREESESNSDIMDLGFEYNDSDKYTQEIAELYSYTEEVEFHLNREQYDDCMKSFESKLWSELDDHSRKRRIMWLLNDTDSCSRPCRTSTLRALLYIAQGLFSECKSEEEQEYWTQHNTYLLFECGTFSTFTELLLMEVENSMAASAALRKPAVSLADSADLRMILNVMYIMLETLRCKKGNDLLAWDQLRAMIREELCKPVTEDECLAVVLFGMITKFCSGAAPHFPMKKVLLLLWKVVLMMLGGLTEFYKLKNELRVKQGLSPLKEDTNEVCRHMRASSPPTSAADLIEQQRPMTNRSIRMAKKGLQKQSSLEDSPFDSNDDDDDDVNGSNGDTPGMDTPRPSLSGMDTPRPGSDDEDGLPPTPPRPPSPLDDKGLPWTPKVRQRDLEVFLDQTRNKFVGFTVPNDHTSLAGLPQPIHEGVKILQQHLYVSLSEIQVKREEEIVENPLSKGETDIPETPAEILYRGMLPNLPQYMIALLKILLAAAPTSKAKTETINILADVLPEEMPTTVLQSMTLGIDVNRHKEIIVKAIAALLPLLLKYFKLNHVYQFEFMSQHLVFANCIPLVLKFFNQTISSYVTAKNSITVIDFPSCVIGERPEITAESLEDGDQQLYCWRNLFSCINLLRILNKLTKWKHSRTMMLVVFKSAPILKRALKVRQSMMQLYILKLLKMQTKYLGRQWRKTNMKTLSAIYQKVRHRLNDDWAYGNDMDARPWDFQAEECALRACVDKFNTRRYETPPPTTSDASGTAGDPQSNNQNAAKENDFFTPVDNCLQSVLAEDIELSDDFKENYELWLENEVHNTQIDWSQVLVQ